MPLEFKRADDLRQLACHSPRAQAVAQPGQLHGNGRAAGPSGSAAERGPGAPDKRGRIHSGMVLIVLVFVAQRRPAEIGRDFLEWRPDAILLVGRQRDAEQFAVTGSDALRKRNPVEQRRLWQRHPEGRSGQTDAACSNQPATQPGFPIRPHFPSVTAIFPPFPRPLMSRLYIDSAKTGGTTNSPRLQDLIW